MIGGYQILDLRGINLQISNSASSITDPNVLKQLLQLREHIDKAYNFNAPLVNQLKPVLIRFRDKKNGEKTEGATFGEMSVVGNYYTFKITGRISGQFTLIINVAFHEVTNAYGNKEWLINTATIQLVDASNVLEGDIAIDGDLSVSGLISGGEIVEDMEGYSATLKEVNNLTIENVYTGVVKNGNKITFVTALKVTRTGAVATDSPLVEFTIPSAVGSKLYPVNFGESAYNDGLAFLDVKPRTSYKLAGTTQIGLFEKYSGTKVVAYLCDIATINQLVENTTYYIRLETTFLLSDNLISNE